MKRKLLGWLTIIAAIGIITLAILYLTKGSFVMAIGIPIGVYIIVKYLPYVRGETKHESQTR